MTDEQYLELVARLDDHDASLKHLMKQFGPATWQQVKQQRDANIKASGTKAPLDRGNFVYTAQRHEVNKNE